MFSAIFKPLTKQLHIPKFALPFFVSTIGHKLPQWPHAVALAGAFNLALKAGLFPEDSLSMMDGRTLLIEVQDAGARMCVRYRSGLFHPVFALPEAADVTIRASLSAFLQLISRQEDPDTLFFNRELSIEGDTELGLVTKNMLDAIDWPSVPNFFRTAACRA